MQEQSEVYEGSGPIFNNLQAFRLMAKHLFGQQKLRKSLFLAQTGDFCTPAQKSATVLDASDFSEPFVQTGVQTGFTLRELYSHYARLIEQMTHRNSVNHPPQYPWCKWTIWRKLQFIKKGQNDRKAGKHKAQSPKLCNCPYFSKSLAE